MRSAQAQVAHDDRAELRAALRDRLFAEGDTDLALMLDKCGEPIRLTCTTCGKNSLGETHCKKRWCPACAYQIAAERVKKYAAAAARFQWPLFVTLTIQNTPDPEGLQKIKKAWQKFRRRKLIAEKVRSGIVGYEITNKGNGWHPHLHALLDCRWLSLYTPEPVRSESAERKAAKCTAAAEELGRNWADLTQQDTVSVRVRRADKNALVEVLKYSCKGSELLTCAERPGPLIRLMLGCRLMTTFGKIRREMQDEDLEQEDAGGCGCPNCGAINTMIPTAIVDAALRQSYDSRNHR